MKPHFIYPQTYMDAMRCLLGYKIFSISKGGSVVQVRALDSKTRIHTFRFEFSNESEAQKLFDYIEKNLLRR